MTRRDRWPSERRRFLDPHTGTRIEQLTAYPANHWHLSAPDTPLTPAGEFLLFTSDRPGEPSPSLFRLETRTGAIAQVTHALPLDPEGMTPAARGMQAIAALPGDEGEVIAIDLETGEVETLAVFLGARLEGCHRSTSGEYVVTVVTREEEATITAVHTEGMRAVPIHSDLCGPTAARFSPDSKNSVLYVTTAPASLRCTAFDGTGDRELCSGVQAFGVRCSVLGAGSDTAHRTPHTEHPSAFPPSWLGTGDEALFIAGPGPGPLMTVPRQGGSPRVISSLPCRWARSNGAGDRIVALASGAIVLIDPRSREARPLCSSRSAEGRPCFSPDGRSVIFSDDDERGYTQLFIAFLDQE